MVLTMKYKGNAAAANPSLPLLFMLDQTETQNGTIT